MSNSDPQSTNFSSVSSSTGSYKKSHQKQYKIICEDLQARLRKALDQSSQNQKQINTLEQQLLDQKRDTNQLEMEKRQLLEQINSLNEEISIQKTKFSFIKKEFEQQKNENAKLSTQINDLESINQNIVQKFKSKSSQLKKLTQVFKEGNFDQVIENLNNTNNELQKQLSNEQEANVNNQSQINTLKQQNKTQSDKIDRLKNKITLLENTTKDFNQASTSLSNISHQLAQKNQEYNELLQNHTNALKKIDDLQTQLAQFQIIQQQNQQMKMRIDSISIENKKLYSKINTNDTLERENERLKSENYALTTQLKQIEKLTTENQSLKSRITELELQSQKLKIANDKFEIMINNKNKNKKRILAELNKNNENNAFENYLDKNDDNEDSDDDAYVKTLRNEIKEMKEKILEANATRIERDTLLQDVRILEEKVKKLRSAESENVELKLRVDALLDELNTAQQRESRLNENIKCLMQDRQQLEVVRNKLLKIEDEIDDRHIKEQQLEYQINFFKSQSREQKMQIDHYEEEIHQLQAELFKYKENMVQHKATEKRKERHKSRLDAHTKLIMKQLDDERKKNIKAQSKIKNLEHTVNRYKIEFEQY